jgi:hypothetical protein
MWRNRRSKGIFIDSIGTARARALPQANRRDDRDHSQNADFEVVSAENQSSGCAHEQQCGQPSLQLNCPADDRGRDTVLTIFAT